MCFPELLLRLLTSYPEKTNRWNYFLSEYIKLSNKVII